LQYEEIEGFALVFLCSASGKVREEALGVLDLVAKIFRSSDLVNLTGSGNAANSLEGSPLLDSAGSFFFNQVESTLRVSDVLSEVGPDVLTRLTNEHAGAGKLKNVASVARKDGSRDDHVIWTYCLTGTMLFPDLCVTFSLRRC